MQVSISHSTLLSHPFAQSLSLPPSVSPFLSFSVILRGSADSRGMIEEGLLQRRGKWSANGTLSPTGHLLTLHSPAAHSASMRVCLSMSHTLIHVCPCFNQHIPLSFPCNFPSLFSSLHFIFRFDSASLPFCFFNCAPSRVLVPPKTRLRAASTFQSSSDHSEPD